MTLDVLDNDFGREMTLQDRMSAMSALNVTRSTQENNSLRSD